MANLIALAAALRVKKEEITEVKRKLQTLAGRARHGSWHYPPPSFWNAFLATSAFQCVRYNQMSLNCQPKGVARALEKKDKSLIFSH